MSRTITENAIEKFLNAETFKSSNTTVEVLPNVTTLKLFNNEIAYYSKANKLSITKCGWKSNTTKERLNGLPNVKIIQKAGKWFLNGAEWNGELIEIN
jgi:Leucine-rich repeat (LRR) protein